MKSVFVRHNCSSTMHVLQQLWDRRLIALHYQDHLSTDPHDYDSAGRQALTRLWSYCETGAIVGADYRRLNGGAMLVGYLPAGSCVRGEEFRDPDTRQAFVYKVAELQAAREVRFVDYPLLFGVQPRQTTSTGWPAADKVLAAALHNQPLQYDASCLHPSQLEVLCYEYLREKRLLEKLLMPIGRGLPDIDILGLDEHGQRVIAQVTHSVSKSELADKQARLLQHAQHWDRCFFFLPESAPVDMLNGVVRVSVERVLCELMKSKHVSTRRMLSVMFAGTTADTPFESARSRMNADPSEVDTSIPDGLEHS
jgi:hypothetical protein